MRAGRRALGVAALVALAAWLAWAFRPERVPVELGTASRGPLVVTVDEDARTRVVDRFIVHAPLSGDLLRPDVKAGDAVSAGDVVARLVPRRAPLLDPRSRAEATARAAAARAALEVARAQVRRAEADLDLARAENARVVPLHAAGQVSAAARDAAAATERARAADLDSARFSETVAAFDLRQAEAVLEDGRDSARAVEVRSPVAATILRVIEESAGPVEAGQHLLELGDPGRLEVVADLLSADAARVPVGARAILEGWGGPPLTGRVERVEPSAVTKVSALGIEEQRVDVVISLADPPEVWKAAGDGYALDARIVTWESENVLRVPASALFPEGDAWAAFVVEDGRARKRAIEVGHRSGLLAEITGGLAEGAVVVVHPSDRVDDGVRVRERGATGGR